MAPCVPFLTENSPFGHFKRHAQHVKTGQVILECTRRGQLCSQTCPANVSGSQERCPRNFVALTASHCTQRGWPPTVVTEPASHAEQKEKPEADWKNPGRQLPRNSDSARQCDACAQRVKERNDSSEVNCNNPIVTHSRHWLLPVSNSECEPAWQVLH